ncbi:zinc ion binding / nucleic acid binding protein [Thalictrum thalictroides]|uniref:Zinc ion binding / nucleic acid binding protein n=1 Tax=Thalictrum thalictroides TaxID=46969 RepID=A0A7J6XE69_THATH|nr:zinc ion binding / nucleic acid binding protein [Thalictrum thalictroides]
MGNEEESHVSAMPLGDKQPETDLEGIGSAPVEEAGKDLKDGVCDALAVTQEKGKAIVVEEDALNVGENSSSTTKDKGNISPNNWATLFRNERGKNSSVDLLHYDPEYINGMAKCPQDVLDLGEKEWNDYLVGFFMGKRLPYPVVKEALAKQWKAKGSYDVATDEDFFYFKFSQEEDKRSVMELGPIFIAGMIFIVKPWSSGIEAQRKQIKSVPLWVTIHGIPKKLWTKEGLSYVGSLLGKPICSDEATAQKTRLTFAKICVEVDSVFDLPVSKQVDIGEAELVTLQFEYPWKPQQCSKCKEYGHTDKRCGMEKVHYKKKKQTWVPKPREEKAKESWKKVEKKHNDQPSIGVMKEGTPMERAEPLERGDSIVDTIVISHQCSPKKTIEEVHVRNKFNALEEEDESDDSEGKGEAEFLESSSEEEVEVTQLQKGTVSIVQTRAQKSKSKSSPVTVQKSKPPDQNKKNGEGSPSRNKGGGKNLGSGTQPSKSY